MPVLKSGGSLVQLASGRMATAMVTDIIPEQTIVVPERIVYPELRRAFESGTFAAGDVITVSVTVKDADGNDKTPENSDFELSLDNYVADNSMEVLGILYMNFIESTKPPAEEVTLADSLPPAEELISPELNP